MTDENNTRSPKKSLPLDGFSRWEQLKHFIPVSRETWRKLCKEGRAPQPQRWTNRCTVFSNEEIHRWMKDPASYRTSVDVSCNHDYVRSDGICIECGKHKEA